MKMLSLGIKPKDDFSRWLVGSDYELKRVVGSGSYGSVAEAVHKSSQKKVAIKKMDDIFDDNEDCKKMVREILLLKAMMPTNYVTKILDIIEPTDMNNYKDIYVVQEYVDADLKKVIKSSLTLTELHVQVIIYNVLCSLKFIHSARILHRDIKPSNILIDEDCKTKLCDFGLARSCAGLTHDPSKIYNEVKRKLSETNQERTSNGLKELDQEESRKLIRSVLEQTKEERSKGKRRLSDHVVTRWYRPPEIILIEKQYGPEVDIWGVGCIMAELLQKLQEHVNDPNTVKDQALFPGKSCFPLSPDKYVKKNGASKFPISEYDQLNVVMEVLGSPTEEDLSFITDQTALNYIKEYPTNYKGIDFEQRFPYASKNAIDLMRKMVQFNPFFRLSVAECLEHPFFEKVRKPSSEEVATNPILIELDSLDKEFSIKDLKQILLKEIIFFKEKKAKYGQEFILHPGK